MLVLTTYPWGVRLSMGVRLPSVRKGPPMRIHDPGKTRHTGQTHRTATPAPPVQRSAVHDVLRGSGHPLAASLQEEMETRLGADFSQRPRPHGRRRPRLRHRDRRPRLHLRQPRGHR